METLFSAPIASLKLENSSVTITLESVDEKGFQKDPIPLNRVSRLQLRLMKDGKPFAAEAVRFDARMPEHNHGMLLKAVTKPIEGGIYQIDGVKLHMEGNWELQVFVTISGKEKKLLIPYKV